MKLSHANSVDKSISLSLSISVLITSASEYSIICPSCPTTDPDEDFILPTTLHGYRLLSSIFRSWQLSAVEEDGRGNPEVLLDPLLLTIRDSQRHSDVDKHSLTSITQASWSVTADTTLKAFYTLKSFSLRPTRSSSVLLSNLLWHTWRCWRYEP